MLIPDRGKPRRHFDAGGGRVRARSNVDDIQGFVGSLSDESRPLLHRAPSLDLSPRHGNASQDREDDQHAGKGPASQVGDVCEAVKKVRDPVVVGAKGELLLLRYRESGSVELERGHRVIDELLHFFKRQANGHVSEILDLSKCGDRRVELLQAVTHARGKRQLVEFVQIVVHV